jgi:hypothetical protein
MNMRIAVRCIPSNRARGAVSSGSPLARRVASCARMYAGSRPSIHCNHVRQSLSGGGMGNCDAAGHVAPTPPARPAALRKSG